MTLLVRVASAVVAVTASVSLARLGGRGGAALLVVLALGAVVGLTAGFEVLKDLTADHR